MRLIDRLRADIRQMGGPGWTLYAADRGLDRLSGGRVRLWAFRFYAQPLPERPLLPGDRGRGRIVVRPVSAGQVDAALFERPPGAVEQRFRDGSVCIAARDGDQLAGFMWLQFGTLRERLLACDFEPLPAGLACWDYDFEVMPRYRLGRTFARLWDEAFAVLRARGTRLSVSWIAFANLASQRAHERMGAKPVGWLLVLDVFGFKLALSPERPFVRLASPGRRLHVRVDASRHLPRPDAGNADTGESAPPAAHCVARNQTPDPDRG